MRSITATAFAKKTLRAIAAAGAVTVACPATIAYLDLPQRAPVRSLLERGAEVALASDYNPGTSPCFNLQTVAYFGRKLFGMTAAEALYGVTRAAARSLRAEAGTLQAGGPADFVALQIEAPEEFGWQHGGNLAVGGRAQRNAPWSMSSYDVRGRLQAAKNGATLRSRCATASSLKLATSQLCTAIIRTWQHDRFRKIASSCRDSSTVTAMRIRFCCAAGRTICTFAQWRSDALYKVVPHLTPDEIRWIFIAAFSEMLPAGITTVAEFFYLNGAGNEHAEAAIAAAAETGIRLVFARTWMDADYAPPQFRESIDDAAARTDDLAQ